jgi:hypothetical protein
MPPDISQVDWRHHPVWMRKRATTLSVTYRWSLDSILGSSCSPGSLKSGHSVEAFLINYTGYIAGIMDCMLGVPSRGKLPGEPFRRLPALELEQGRKDSKTGACGPL